VPHALAVRGLRKRYGSIEALKGVDLEVGEGELVGLLGPNGAGKSTLIGMLATLVAPTSGDVRYGGRSARELGPPLRRQIGLLAHELHLYTELTARQNLTFFSNLYGLDPRPTVELALERAGLADRADEDVVGFSRGMRQRLALERALLHAPRLVLFDEPFTGLDDKAVGLVSARLRRLAADGAIVVLATHDLDLADGLVTRVAVVQSGRLVSDEPASAGLRERYRSLVGTA
jgi:heme exporter protein A